MQSGEKKKKASSMYKALFSLHSVFLWFIFSDKATERQGRMLSLAPCKLRLKENTPNEAKELGLELHITIDTLWILWVPLYCPGCAPKALFHPNILLYPIAGLKWRDRPHTQHAEYSPNWKAWKDLEVVLMKNQDKEWAASRPFYTLYFRFLSQFCQ